MTSSLIGRVSVRVRDLDIATSSDDYFREPPVDVRVERIFAHPDYRREYRAPNRGLFSDIALIKLSSELEFSDISKPICLPQSKRSTKEYERIRRSYIAGWGLTEFAGDASTVMMWATVNITDHNTCQTSYARTGARVDDSEHICAAGDDLKQDGCVPGANDGSCRGGVDACEVSSGAEGDSGGPLMERRDEFNRQRWYTIGVVSFGTGCGNPVFPGLYTRVDHFLDWIAQTVSEN
ncbi:Phenoloxidase-activating factor 3 [Amphibalanus amphitrite]|uniref:Phenoloxidase-activating factor 3 n=1 Tax=Amphibalanus amphitrite TaxID=1232801 RepID=A0A6A4WDL2_AMPAM|nr:Phenoloxidase-activating factor 3 [Amphibalanus amphitrite]